ncbi:hypothetical protein AGMMS49944_26220 [Spirochaetia bacterium]|nr:hypothetical protein AGMMS49944_26220 [Spirochaetia bacterium]
MIEPLNEPPYTWELDPADRSWFIGLNGEILSDVSHRIILKRSYKIDWERLKQRGDADDAIERILVNRLVQSGTTKIGELDEFNVFVDTLDSRHTAVIRGFCQSLAAKRSDLLTKTMVIHQVSKEPIRYLIADIMNGCLFR